MAINASTPVMPAILDIPGYVVPTGPGFNLTNGNVYYVNSAAGGASDTGAGTNPTGPFKTLQHALAVVTPNNGDVIICMPGHVETVAGAAGLNFIAGTADGVTVYFCGSASDRALINLTTSTAAQIVVAANNVTLVQPRIQCSFDAVAIAMSISGNDCTIINGEFLDTAAAAATVQIATTSTANRLTISGYTYYASTTGTQKTDAIRIVGGDHHRLENLNIAGNFSTACVNNVTTATTNLLGRGWYLTNTSTADALSTNSAGQFATLSTSTYLNPDNSQGNAGNEYCISKTLALPQTGVAGIFTIVGGPIQVLYLGGVITTVIGSVANATKLTWVPTVGGSSTDVCATTDLNAAAAGDLLTCVTSFATAITLTTAGILVGTGTTSPLPFTAAPGIIKVNCAGSDGGTGRIQWVMRYKPLSPNCFVF
jgi:hypothetical protein